MATADEILAAELGLEDNWFEIDLLSRRIVIPKAITNLGVKSDKDTMHVRFKLPRFYNGIDFSEFQIGIDYTNAQGEEDRYEPEDVSVSDNIITFTWVIGRHASMYEGAVTFGLCVKKLDPDNPDDPQNEFHTTKTTLPILDGMETCEEAIVMHTDLLEQWREQLFGQQNSMVANLREVSQSEQNAIVNKAAEVLATIPVDYQTAVSMTDNADRTKADAIIRSSEGDVITLSDSSDDYLRGLKIFGKTTQIATTYEPYTGGVSSPSPDYPQSLLDVANPLIAIHGKNMFDPNTCKIYNDKGEYPSLGNVTVSGNNIVLTKTSAAAYFYGQYINVEPGKSYTVSFNGGKNMAGDVYAIYIYHNEPFGDVLTTLSSGVHASKTFVTTTERIFVGLYACGSTTTTEQLVYSEVQLERGNVETDFVSGVAAQTFMLPNTLSGVPVLSGGNYTDANGQQWICDEIDFSKGIYIQRVGKVTASDLTFTLADGNGYPVGESQMFSAQLPYPLNIHAGKYREIVCSKLPYTTDMLRNDVNGGYVYLNGLYCRIQGVSDLETFNSLIADAVFYIPLTNPIETTLAYTELSVFKALHSNYPNTTIFNDAGAWMEVTYNADTGIYLENCLRPTDEQVAAAVYSYLKEHPANGSVATIGEVILLASEWKGSASPYSQVVEIAGVTENSQVDLTPSIAQLAIFHDKDLAFVTENANGIVTVYALGDKPSNDYTIQVTITEVYV